MDAVSTIHHPLRLISRLILLLVVLAALSSQAEAQLSFGAFLQVGDFSFPSETAVVIFLCMAFQNGFFWQTLLPAGTVAAKAD